MGKFSILKRLIARAIKAWDLDLRSPALARRQDKRRCDPAQIAAQTRAESAWRRQHVRHMRARQAAWQSTLQLVSKPSAWLAQGGEVLLFSIKMLCAYWAAVSGILMLWCLATSTPISEVPPEGKSAAAAFASLWLMTCVMWWIFRLKLPIKSPFLNTWRETYASTLLRAEELQRPNFRKR